MLTLLAGVLLALGVWTSPAQADQHRQEGSWSPGGQLNTRAGSVTRLPDGRVLIVESEATEIWDPDTRESRLTNPPKTDRSARAHTATLLDGPACEGETPPDWCGTVLVAGGAAGGADGSQASAEVFDPDSEQWTTVGSMNQGRRNHSATRLPDGRVLVAGGQTGSQVDLGESAEIYDPGTQEWTQTDSMAYLRTQHTATRLDDGRILVAGGAGAPAAEESGGGSDDITAKTATRLNNRGTEDQTFEFTVESQPLPAGAQVTITLDSAEQGGASYSADDSLYDSQAGDVTAAVDPGTSAVLTFTPDADLATGTTVTVQASRDAVTMEGSLAERHEARFTRTDTSGSDTTTFIIGPTKLASAEVFDPDSETWQTAAPMNAARGATTGRRHFAVALDGTDTVLMVGRVEEGQPEVEVYLPGADPGADDAWQGCSEAADTPACLAQSNVLGPRLTALDDGTVLLVGYALDERAKSVQRYDPADNEWWLGDLPENFLFNDPNTVLANGHVFYHAAKKAEVYSPETVPPPVVESVTPGHGPVAGGFEVTIKGQDLADAIFVSFGERGDYRVGDVTQVSPSELKVVAPAHPAEFAPVRVATPGGITKADTTVELEFVAADGEWAATGGMAGARSSPGAVTLDGAACAGESPPDYCGRVLVVDEGSSEVYNPDTGRFRNAAALPFDVHEPAELTTLLDGPACRGDSPHDHCGKVLVLNGSPRDDADTEAALYDPAENEWQACGNTAGFDCPPDLDVESSSVWEQMTLTDGPECHDPEGSAPDHCGTVLANAFDIAKPPRMFVFDPDTGQWDQTATPNAKRDGSEMTLVEGQACEGENPPEACGNVLLTSGTYFIPGDSVRTVTAELYDPAGGGSWRNTAEDPMPGVDRATATTLPDGRVVVAGGHLDLFGAIGAAQVFDPRDESWQPLPDMPERRYGHGAALLPDGRVMLAGGKITTPAGGSRTTSSVLVFDPEAGAEGQWSYTDSLLDARAGAGAQSKQAFPLVPLPDGRVLAAGGESLGRSSPLASAELYSLNPGSVAGVVLDAGTGAAVEGAEVTVTDAGGAAVGSATTGADGTYQVSGVAFGEYTVTADATGYDPASQDGVTVKAGEATRQDFALAESAAGGGGGAVQQPEDGLVAGAVTDAESGQSLEGVEVSVDGPTTASTTTDAEGGYQLAGLAAGSYTVTANAEGYETASQSVEVVEGEAATADFALQPEAAAAGATGSVAGAVTDAGSGDPVAGAEVTVTDTAGSVVVSAGTDAGGAYTAEGLAPGEYTLTVEAAGYEAASQSVSVAAGETAAADFALQAVTDGDQPVDSEEPTGALGGDLTSAQLVESACDPAAVPDAGFGDVAGSVHEDSVACVAWYGLTLGLGDLDGDGQLDYGPNRPVTRDQMASFIARLATEAGVDLPADAADAFGDDDGSVHEDNINALAAANITQGVGETQYAPRNPVSRDQMASFLVRLAGEAGLGLSADAPDAFGDDDGSVHEDNINALAAANITRGVSEGVYAPRNPVSRGQMASFLGRLLGGFVESGIAPAGGAEVSLDSASAASGGQLAGEVFAHKDVVSLTADGCGLSEREVSVAADGGFTVDIPAEQPVGDCELAFAVSTTRGGDAPVQTARYGFGVTVEAGGA